MPNINKPAKKKAKKIIALAKAGPRNSVVDTKYWYQGANPYRSKFKFAYVVNISQSSAQSESLTMNSQPHEIVYKIVAVFQGKPRKPARSKKFWSRVPGSLTKTSDTAMTLVSYPSRRRFCSSNSDWVIDPRNNIASSRSSCVTTGLASVSRPVRA